MRPRTFLMTLGILALVTGAGCRNDGPTFGAIRVSVVTTGADLDLDGYTVGLDGPSRLAIAVNGTMSFTHLPTGSHEIALGGVAHNCGVSGGSSRSVTIRHGQTAAVSFPVACVATGVEVTVATGGLDIDHDGYTVSVDGASPLAVPANGSVRITRLPAGTHTLTLSGMAGNCASATGTNPRSVDVPAGEVVPVGFPVTCNAVYGVVEVTPVTSGMDLDLDGYTVGVDYACDDDTCAYAWSDVASGNETVRFATIPVGDHAVYLVGVASNCTVTGANPRTVSVTIGGLTRDTARTTFAVTCQQRGSLRVSVTTTGVDLDPDGYGVGVLRVGGYGIVRSSVGVNASVTIPQRDAGDYSVTLDGLSRNCTVSSQNPVAVTVVGGATGDVAFAVTCAALGRIQVTAATTGSDLDPDGYSVRVQDAGFLDSSYGVAANGTVTIPGLVAGDYVVALQEVAANCEFTSPTPQTVAVPSGGTAVVRFDGACTVAAQLAVVIASDGDEEIYLVKSNGAGLTRLTTNTASDVEPAWSPDGSKVAFATNRDGNFEISVINADGQNPVRLTSSSAADRAPAWSPDGTKIAFTSFRDGNGEIYVMGADGSNPVRLTNHPGFDTDPVWSPDGSKIAFSSTRDGNAEIYGVDATGSGLTRLTSNNVDDVQPAWSPDGTKLVFSRFAWCDGDTGFCEYDLFVMNADGSGAAQLTFGSSDADPAWSPDGRWIAYGAKGYYCDEYNGCYYAHSAVRLVRADGTRVAKLMRDAFQPAWRP